MSRASGPRIRSLKPESWQDERLAGLGDLEHRLYIGLITQADDEGRESANLSLIRARIFPFDARPLEHFGASLIALDAAGLIDLYEAGGRSLLQITSWAEDQRVDKPQLSKLPNPPADSATFANHRDESRTVENDPEPSRTLSPSRAPADRTRPDQTGPDLSSSPDGAEPETREDVHQLCHLLADLMRSNDPKAKTRPDTKTWQDPMRLLLDRDGREPDLIERVIRWSQADDFWRTNILSPSKLRERFPQLLLKMQAGVNGNGHDPAADFSKYDVATRRAAA